MRRLSLTRLAAVLLCLAFAADAGAAGLEAHAILWRLERTGFKPSYIFGTSHSSAPDIIAFSPGIRAALSEADSVTGEVDIALMRDRLKAMRFAARPEERADAVLDRSLLGSLSGLAERYGFARDEVGAMAPWYILAVMMTSDAAERARRAAGAEPDDEVIQDMARKAGKLAPPLEGLDEHLAVFTEMSMADQLSMLGPIIRGRVGQPDDARRETLTLYRRRDLEEMRRRYLDSVRRLDDPGPWLRYEQRVEVDRNRKMTERLERDYFPTGSVFVAVGAGHLAGDDGLIALLRQRGWTATPVE